ncbi:MAG: hypothetical protein NZ524_10215 [Thiobacillaceae bacterium]|nr:hypothetical protein [Thiobacillaceae bacterium]MDW8322548.1 hypothetical protein [Burkholderiales bacterium]
MSLPASLSSPDHFHTLYVAGLTRLLGPEAGPGGYILALANAALDAMLWQTLERRLEERHYHLGALVTSALRQGRALDVPEDDLVVLLKLMAMGFESVGRAERRQAGPWELSYNPLRALRPPRASRRRMAGLYTPFDPEGFHFNRPELQAELMWSGELLGREARLYYNKFPLVELHGILVPEPGCERAQWLTAELHDWAWEVTQALARTLPGFGLAYNSLGAHASVNHLHFQSFVRTAPLPVALPQWTHNGGAQPYPSACQRFDAAAPAWAAIEALHAQGRPYNLIYLPGRLYLLPRRAQGDYPCAAWTQGHAWYEMAGGVVASSRADYQTLQAEAVAEQLRQVRWD